MPLDTEKFLELREQLALQRKLNARIRADGLAFYRPHPKQDLFHKAGATHKRRMVKAGNRFGKSQLGAAEDCAWLRGERSWYPKDSPYRTAGIPPHAVKLRIITTEWDIVDRIWTNPNGEKPGKLWKYLPSDLIKRSVRNSAGVIADVYLKNGSYASFETVKSFLNNRLSSESADWDAIHVDEPCPRDMYIANARGLIDRGGAAWFTLTPLSEPWIDDYFFPEGGTDHSNVWAIEGSIYDNPYLKPEDIAEFEQMLTEDEKQCRLHGISMSKLGLVYKQFSFDKHVLKVVPKGWKSFAEPPRHYTLHVRIDTHPQTPHALQYCAVSPEGYRFYYLDRFEHCKISRLAAYIHAEMSKFDSVGSIECEPAAWIEHPVTGTSMAQEFARCGVPCQKSVKALSSGITVAQSALLSDPQMIWFSPLAARTLWEIRRYSWNPLKPDSPNDVDDHMMENFYRMEYRTPQWVDPKNSIAVEHIEIPSTSAAMADEYTTHDSTHDFANESLMPC